jgi:hypothetical protein
VNQCALTTATAVARTSARGPGEAEVMVAEDLSGRGADALAVSPVFRRLVVVVFDGVSLGIMSFAFGVFELAVYYGAIPSLDVRVVSGAPNAALSGGRLACHVPYDLGALRTADLIIVSDDVA